MPSACRSHVYAIGMSSLQGSLSYEADLMSGPCPIAECRQVAVPATPDAVQSHQLCFRCSLTSWESTTPRVHGVGDAILLACMRSTQQRAPAVAFGGEL